MFACEGSSGVHIVQTKPGDKSHFAVAVDATAGLVMGKEQSVLIKLTVESLASTAGGGDGNPRVIAGRKVVVI